MVRYREVRMIKTFRGLLIDGGQQRLNLHTNDGKTGYRIVKYELFPYSPGTQAQESIVQIWNVEQTTIATGGGVVDFSDNTMLGVGYYRQHSTTTAATTLDVIFDNEVFNQDIFVTHTNNEGSDSMNYYIELEQVKLDLNESTVATLQSIRNA